MASNEYKITYIPIDQLEYDIENPRLPHTVIDSHSEEKVIDWMLKDASIIELMGSIGEKDFFPAEPLLVVKNKKNAKYTVIEGNRRLTAVKLLNNPSLATRRTKSIEAIVQEALKIPKKLPVMEFEKRSQILDYLGFKHITGVKQWSAIAKAKHLKDLQKEYTNSDISINEQYKKLAKAIGSRSDYVRDLLIGLEVYNVIHDNKYFEIDGLDEDSIDFGVYYNALKYSNIPTFIGIDKSSENPIQLLKKGNLEELTKIISEKDENGKTLLGESRNLGTLNDIILEPRAYKMFKSGKSLADAKMYLEGPHEIFKSTLKQIKELIVDAIGILKEINECDEKDVDLVEKVSENLEFLTKKVKSKTS